MKTFQYKGKQRTAAGNRLLFPGCNYDLDEKDKHVHSLLAQGLLSEVVQTIPAPAQSTPNSNNSKKDNK